jgi:hypothetical protein
MTKAPRYIDGKWFRNSISRVREGAQNAGEKNKVAPEGL